jgi:hypothetical protein
MTRNMAADDPYLEALLLARCGGIAPWSAVIVQTTTGEKSYASKIYASMQLRSQTCLDRQYPSYRDHVDSKSELWRQ